MLLAVGVHCFKYRIAVGVEGCEGFFVVRVCPEGPIGYSLLRVY